jgi:hypothetical protein
MSTFADRSKTMTTADYTLDDAGLLHDAHGRFVSRATRLAWELACAHANIAAAGLALCFERGIVFQAIALLSQAQRADWNVPPVNLWKVERRRIATARAFGW